MSRLKVVGILPANVLPLDIQLQPDHPLRGTAYGYPLPGAYAAGLTPVQATGGTDASLQGGLDG